MSCTYKTAGRYVNNKNVCSLGGIANSPNFSRSNTIEHSRGMLAEVLEFIYI